MENKKDIGPAFKEKLDGLQKAPGENVWDSINASLNEMPNKPKYKVPNITLLAGAVLLSAIFIGLMWTGSRKSPSAPVKPDTAWPDNTKENTISKQETISGYNDTTAGSTTLTDKPHTGYPTTDNPVALPANGNQNNALQHNTADKTRTRPAPAYQNREQGKGRTAVAGKNNGQQAIVKDITQTGQAVTTRGMEKGNAAIPLSAADDSKAANGKTLQENKNTLAVPGSSSGHMEKSANAVSASNNYQGTKDTANQKGTTKSDQSGNSPANYTQQNPQANTTAQTPENIASEAGQDNHNNIEPLAIENDSITALAAADTLSLSPKDTVIVQNAKMNEMPTMSRSLYAFAYMAPSLYAGFPESKSLLGREANGPTTSKITFNYGAAVGYQLNEKWGIRVGAAIRKMELSTAHKLKGTPIIHIPVPYGEAFLYKDFEGINYAKGINNGVVISALSDPGTYSAPVDLISRFSFLEIPVEATCQLLQKKRWGAFLTGGASMHFVTRNEVFAQNNRGSILMGSIKGIKSTGIIGNLGVGFYYSLFPAVRINLEPAFRYHTAKMGDTNPISFSVLAGLQYNFNFGKKFPE